MSEHLCLKWNNHSLAFLKSIKNIETKEKYCDATIVCQGKYFPVHRFILSTCSEYFEEIFDRIECPHPYIIFKDIEPREIEFLLSFMYQGEVNVLQEILPTFIKAAEALKIKGLAVPDDFTAGKEEKNKKRANTSTDGSQPKRRAEESVRRKDSGSSNNRESSSLESSNRSSREYSSKSISDENQIKEQIVIKEEPSSQDFESPAAATEFFNTFSTDGTVLDNYSTEDAAYIKPEPADNSVLPVDDQSWSEIDNDFNIGQDFSSSEGTIPNEDISKSPQEASDDYESKYESEMKNESFSADPDFLSTPPEDNLSPTPEENNWTADDNELEQPPRAKTKCSAKSFRCPYCDYVHSCSTDVRNHVLENHTGDRPHACRLCMARFTEKDSLNRHMMTHSRELRGFLSTPRMLKKDAHSK